MISTSEHVARDLHPCVLALYVSAYQHPCKYANSLYTRSLVKNNYPNLTTTLPCLLYWLSTYPPPPAHNHVRHDCDWGSTCPSLAREQSYPQRQSYNVVTGGGGHIVFFFFSYHSSNFALSVNHCSPYGRRRRNACHFFSMRMSSFSCVMV
jgi:hypothetical protein